MTPLVLMFDYFRLLEKHFAVKTIWYKNIYRTILKIQEEIAYEGFGNIQVFW